MSARLAIQPMSPQPGQKLIAEKGHIAISVQITLGCGLPTCAGGRWDPRRFNVVAKLFTKDQPVQQSVLSYSGNVSEFSGQLICRSKGPYTIIVEAQDPETGAAGNLRLECV